MGQSWFLRKRGLRNNENAGLTLQKNGSIKRAPLSNRSEFQFYCSEKYSGVGKKRGFKIDLRPSGFLADLEIFT